MIPTALWQVSVTTMPEAEEAVTQLLERAFGQGVSSYTDAETQLTVVSLYLGRKLDWSQARQEELATSLRQVNRSGLVVGSGQITLKRLRRQDWAESWKRHFKPLTIGSALLLKPSWSRRRPRQGQAVIVLDPGLSFGTGQHPTTAFCLRQLVAQRGSGAPKSFLDIGTGSGILAIAAAKLGYAPVHAFDLDPESIRVARANAQRNGVAARVRLQRQDLTKLSRLKARQYSLVCANLTARLLMAERRRILARLRADGVLVVAGILEAQFAQVQGTFERAGLRLVAAHTQKEWRSGAFTWR
jgi:ribosomal protein L11 methyltransferase